MKPAFALIEQDPLPLADGATEVTNAEGLVNEADVIQFEALANDARAQAASSEEKVTELREEVLAAAQKLAETEAKEQELHVKAERAKETRVAHDVKTAAEIAAYDARLYGLSEDMNTALQNEAIEREDMLRAQVRTAEVEQKLQKEELEAVRHQAKLDVDRTSLEARLAQRVKDQKEIDVLKREVAEREVSADAELHEKQVHAMSEAAGKKMGAKARSLFEPGTPEAEKVAAALSDAAAAGQTVADDGKNADLVSVNVELVPS